MSKAFVLLSGGIDSTVCLYLARRQFGQVEGVSIDYGQRHRKEMEFARASCRALDIDHHILDISKVMPRTMLTDETKAIPEVAYSEIFGVSPTYVPFRNGFMLAAVTSYVAGEYDDANQGDREDDEWAIYFGAHAEDAQSWAYPDCTPEFIGAMANAIWVGSYRTIRLMTPLQWANKQDIIRLGETLKVDWSLTWSCYVGGAVHCGVCPTCRARRAGFRAAEVPDPTAYVEEETGAKGLF